MARKPAPPSYKLHKASGQAYTRINGKMIYLGEFGSTMSHEKYHKNVGDWPSGNLESYGTVISVGRLAIAYVAHAECYYVKDGKPTSEVGRVRLALRHLVEEAKTIPANRFTPKHLERIRQAMINQNFSRKTINDYIGIIGRAFRFGVVEGSVDSNVWQSLKALPGLRKGLTQAKESSPVIPVKPFDVVKTLRQLGPIVSTMVRLQLVTGMRPGEICSMRLADIDMSDEIWRYNPGSHKTEHHGKCRRIQLGRKAQRLLNPFLTRTNNSLIFSPRGVTGDPLLPSVEFSPDFAASPARRLSGLSEWFSSGIELFIVYSESFQFMVMSVPGAAASQCTKCRNSAQWIGDLENSWLVL